MVSTSEEKTGASGAARFALPQIVDNLAGGWGPAPDLLPAEYKDVPYAPFSKGDKLGRIADWTNPEASNSAGQAGYAGPQGRDRDGRGGRYVRNYKDSYQAYGSAFASTFAYVHGEDEASFSVVDNRSAAVKKGVYGRTAQKTRGGRGGFRGGHFQRLGGGPPTDRSARGGPSTRGGARKKFGWKDYDKPQRVRDASVNIGADWKVLEEIDFNRLAKLAYEEPEVEDIAWYGDLPDYDKLLDRVTVKTEKPLQGASNKEKYTATTSEDPVIQQLADEGKGTVFATDAILACLMSTTRSVYPWDIVITRTDNKLFFDKRDGGVCDYVSVNENAAEPPAETGDKDNINSAVALSTEATSINDRFVTQAAKEGERKSVGKPLPVEHPERMQECAFRYRKWNLGDESCVLVARTAIESAIRSTSTNQADTYVVLRALNEFDSKATGAGGALNWRQKLDTQRGAVLATEMKNNANKLIRWTCEAALSGADQMRMGFISRLSPKDNTRHSIIGTQVYKPTELAAQINFPLTAGWGIVKTISDMCLKLPEGKYVLVKDPNKSIVRLYSIPTNAFDYEEVEASEIASTVGNAE